MYTIEYEKFLDKVHGCWYGKCLGGAAGAPVEGLKKIIEVEDFSQIFDPDIPNDDLDFQLLWLEVLEEKGTLIKSTDLADAWIEKCWYTFSEYGYFIKNYMRGIKPPYTGIINNSFFKEGMGCPIRSEIWGIISAGNPELASQYAYMDATLDHADNSVYAEQFLAAAESIAFFESDIEKIVKTGMEFIPSDSKLYKCYKMILDFYENNKEDFLEARRLLIKNYSHNDFTNSVQNLGIILIALLYGEGDMRKTINIALRCGYDTDCTCASAGAIIGIICGYNGLDEEVKSLINDYFICGIDVHRSSNSIESLAIDSTKIALKTPNYNINIINSPYPEERPDNFGGFRLEKVTEEGLENAKKSLSPIVWEIFGPFFEQQNILPNPDYPSPHGENSDLPDLVYMINNYVSLDKEYITKLEKKDKIGEVISYDDFIDVDSCMKMTGQMCCYARAVIKSPKAQKAWIVIGNNDGFEVAVNGEKVLKRDEIRLWTPYNNYALIDLKKGENEFIYKLLRRTEQLKFAVGLREYTGEHWHRSRWLTDLK